MSIKQNKMHKTSQKQAQILGVGLSSTSVKQVLTSLDKKIALKAKNKLPLVVFTPNPEIVLYAHRHKDFIDTLNKADVSVPDGVGLSQAFYFTDLPLTKLPLIKEIVAFCQGIITGLLTLIRPKVLEEKLKTIKGRVLFMEIVKKAHEKNWRLFFLGGKNDSVKKAKEVLEEKFPGILIKIAVGANYDDTASPVSKRDSKLQKDNLSHINEYKTNILFVGFGAPKQERWVEKNIKNINVDSVMVVGGTFDYVSGISKLPPKWMERFNIEWIWRLIREPKRIGRILNAFPLFPLTVFRERIKKA